MAKSVLLDKFMQDVDDLLLKTLIDVYSDALNLSDEERVNNLVAKLNEIFEERSNADHSA